MRNPSLDAEGKATRRARALFLASLATVVAASGVVGAALHDGYERWRARRASSPGEVAVFLEHAAVDVRLGRGGPLVDRLAALSARAGDPAARERILALLAEAALQAGRLSDAAAAEAQREPLVAEPDGRAAVRLRRVGLAAAQGHRDAGEELAKPLLQDADPRLADEARLRLAASMEDPELRAWIASADPRSPEQVRRAGMAALHLLGDAEAAAPHLARLFADGQRDPSLLGALIEVYGKLQRHAEVARVAEALLAGATVEDRDRVALVRARALGHAGDAPGALAALEPLRRSRDARVRVTARRDHYELLRESGRLQSALAALRDPGERAFVALEVERDYALAARLYQAASRQRPDSQELAAGLREAERRRELAERRVLYERVLAKDQGDSTTRDKLLAVLVALGEDQAARRMVAESFRRPQPSPEELLGAAASLGNAGLDRDAAALLERAYAAEQDPARRQLILFSLGDLYVAARRDLDARRLYAGLANEGASAEIRERAVARLAPLLR